MCERRIQSICSSRALGRRGGCLKLRALGTGADSPAASRPAFNNSRGSQLDGKRALLTFAGRQRDQIPVDGEGLIYPMRPGRTYCPQRRIRDRQPGQGPRWRQKVNLELLARMRTTRSNDLLSSWLWRGNQIR